MPATDQKMGRTKIPVTLRVPADIVRQVAAVQGHFPEIYETTTDVYLEAIRRGLLAIAAESTRPRPGQYANFDLADLCALLRSKMLPLADFMLAHGMLPVHVTVADSRPNAPAAWPTRPVPARSADLGIDPTAATGLEILGTTLLE